MYKGFSRKEASVLTGLTLNQLDHLSRQHKIKPEKFGNARSSSVLYDWHQVIDLKIISKLKERNVPPTFIYAFLEMLRIHEYKLDFFEKYMIHLNIPDEEKEEILKKGIYEDMKISKNSIPERNTIGIEHSQVITLNLEDKNYKSLSFIIFTREELNKWVQELLDNPNYSGVKIIHPLGNVISEIYDVARKEITNFDSRLQDAEKVA